MERREKKILLCFSTAALCVPCVEMNEDRNGALYLNLIYRSEFGLAPQCLAGRRVYFTLFIYGQMMKLLWTKASAK